MFTLNSRHVQVHYQIGNKKDGFHFWCIPNWEERGMWKIFQVFNQIFSLQLSVLERKCLCRNINLVKKSFQLYMMAIVVVMPTIMMTFAYTAISRAVSISFVFS